MMSLDHRAVMERVYDSLDYGAVMERSHVDTHGMDGVRALYRFMNEHIHLFRARCISVNFDYYA